ncbi:MAG: beta-phosphoglucomutase [Lachnospiraceae bacterium]|nr:beta-phosphoglucomutase [Lachnospiraceae bacterium]
MDTEAVIFDLDGVLVHTDKYHYLAWKQLSDELGIYFDEEINRRLRGVSREQSLEIILENYNGKPFSDDEKKKMANKKNDIYRKYLSEMTPSDVKDEVRDTLHVLKERGYHIAVGSSSKNTGFILEKTDLLNEFEVVSDGTMITRTKPDPEVFLLASKLLSIAPSKCLVVEDADAGIDAGVAGGMKTAAYGEAVKSGKADYILDHFPDLLNICQ